MGGFRKNVHFADVENAHLAVLSRRTVFLFLMPFVHLIVLIWDLAVCLAYYGFLTH